MPLFVNLFFIINEKLHPWVLEVEGLGFRISRKNSTSDAASQGRSIRLENWSSSDQTEENVTFQRPKDAVCPSGNVPRLCLEMHSPPHPNPVSLMDEALGTGAHLSSPRWHHSSHAYSKFCLLGPSCRLRTISLVTCWKGDTVLGISWCLLLHGFPVRKWAVN